MCPIYEYRCRLCKKITEKLQKVSEATASIIVPHLDCACFSEADRIVSKSNWHWADGMWRGDSSKNK